MKIKQNNAKKVFAEFNWSHQLELKTFAKICRQLPKLTYMKESRNIEKNFGKTLEKLLQKDNIEKYNRKIMQQNTLEIYSSKIQQKNTPAKYNRKILQKNALEK